LIRKFAGANGESSDIFIRVQRGLKSIYLAAAAAVPFICGGSARAAGPFFMGSDISLLSFMQQQGTVYSDNGVQQQADQILYDNGDNLFRLRLFVNPNTSYSATAGAIQTTAYDIALAQQIKQNDPSAKIELDLHYSDSWADPGKQYIPAAWAGETTAQLATSVYNYTYTTLNSFNTAGVMPDIVQVGNEINNGMLWYLQGQKQPVAGETGEISYTGTTQQQQATWAAFGSIVNSGISAVRAAQGAGPKIQVSLVIGNGNSNGEPQYFYGNLTSPSWANVPASSFDVMGVDYYPSSHDISTLNTNLTALANTYNKKIMVMETDAPWENAGSLAHDTSYAETQAGQASYISALAATIQNLPNGDGMGLMYWYPESVQIPGYNIYNGGETALFDNTTSHNALQAVNDFNITQHQWNTSASGTWETGGNWTNSMPNGSDIEADFLGAISTSQTISTSSSITLGDMRFQNANSYTIAGTGSLTLQSTIGWSYVVVQQGAHQINIPTTIASSTVLSVAPGSSLTFGAPVTVNSGQIVKLSGAGTINYLSSITLGNTASMTIGNSTHATALNVGSGATVALTGAGTVLEVDSLSDNGTIDLQTHSLIINYGAGDDPIASIAAYIQSGYNNGAWNGTGIISTTAQTNPAYGIGYADSADPGNPAGLASGQIEVRYTLLGDANLDGAVNGSDFAILASNFNKAVNGWDAGDFNYDGSVNGSDFASLASNFNQGTNASLAMAADGAVSNLLTNVPEPAAGILVIAGTFLMASRRRRRSD
jgi:arabinogalactan endo-1,4-beta-galactosidase